MQKTRQRVDAPKRVNGAVVRGAVFAFFRILHFKPYAIFDQNMFDAENQNLRKYKNR